MQANKTLAQKSINLFALDAKDPCVFVKPDTQHISIFKYLVNPNDINDFFYGNLKQIQIRTIDEDRINQLIKKLKNASNGEQLLALADEQKVVIPETQRTKIIRSQNQPSAFFEAKNWLISHSEKYLNNIHKRFLTLKLKAKQNLKQYGKWYLYLAKYFLKAMFPDSNKTLYAPLVLYAIDIVETKKGFYLEKKEDLPVVNEKLFAFLAIEKKNQAIKPRPEYQKFDVSDYQKELHKLFECEVYLNDLDSNDFQKFRPSTIDKVKFSFTIEGGLCLGLFNPEGEKLKEEYDTLWKSGTINQIFLNQPINENSTVQEQELYDKPILQISKLDVYQRYAIRSALKNNTIIYGPPGTGKSEVIANIIANVLVMNKTVLMVSEKAAALLVLKKRLQQLSVFSLFVVDINDKAIFYKSIQDLANVIGNDWYQNFSGPNPYLPNNNASQWNNLINYFTVYKNYKITLIKFFNFLAQKLSGHDLLSLIKAISNKISIETFFIFLKLNLFKKIEKLLQTKNLKTDEFWNLIKKFEAFSQKYNVDSAEKFAKYVGIDLTIKKILSRYHGDLTTFRFEESYKQTWFLEKMIMKDQYLFHTLRQDPCSLYQQILDYQTIQKDLVGIITVSFFENISTNILSLQPFLNYYNSLKKRYQLACLNNFLAGHDYRTKNWWQTLFKRKKLNAQENHYLLSLIKLNGIEIIKKNYFEELLKNYFYLHPFNVLYYFDKSYLDEANLLFYEQKFSLLNWEIITNLKLINNSKTTYEQLVVLHDLFYLFQKDNSTFLELNWLNDLLTFGDELEWEKIINLIFDITRSQIINKLKALNKEDKALLADAIRVANLKRKRSIHDYLKKYERVLKVFAPIWIANPDQVANYITFAPKYFDYGIFDEASQMFLERAYSMIYRAHINIVAGDDKQLRPTNFFKMRLTFSEDENDYQVDDLEESESLLDRAKATLWNQVMLQNHYRSQSKELIEFSNQKIYENKLNFATLNGLLNEKRLLVYQVNGLFTEVGNEVEAAKIIELLETHHHFYQNILVITFSARQKLCIEQQFDNNSFVSKELQKKYFDGVIEVVNLENVQGNEADLVILSISYGRKDANDSKVKAHFGPLVQKGGSNRLNVAITRAKEKMIVVKSLYAADLATSVQGELGVFKDFLAFLENSEKNTTEAEVVKLSPDFRIPLVQEVYKALAKNVAELNLKLVTQQKIGNKSLDIAVVNEQNYVFLGINVEQWQEHADPIKMHETYEIYKFFKVRNYPFYLILEYEWAYNHQAIINHILSMVVAEQVRYQKKNTTSPTVQAS